MDLDAAKKLIKEYMPGHAAFVLKADIGERYYTNKNDILFWEKTDGKAGKRRESTKKCGQ